LIVFKFRHIIVLKRGGAVEPVPENTPEEPDPDNAGVGRREQFRCFLQRDYSFIQTFLAESGRFYYFKEVLT
jgi:hypothetical protein